MASLNFEMMMFVNRAYVQQRVEAWKLARLSRTGAYGRGVMKKQIRPPLKGRGKVARSVVIVPDASDMPANWQGPPPARVLCYVDPNGPVLNSQTGRPVTRSIAAKARIALKGRHKGQGEGLPPRRGPTDKLRRFIFFQIDVQRESVVIGPAPFPQQPPMLNRVSVPELLNRGGVEIIFGQPVKYGPRPFVETVLPITVKRTLQEIKRHPLR